MGKESELMNCESMKDTMIVEIGGRFSKCGKIGESEPCKIVTTNPVLKHAIELVTIPSFFVFNCRILFCIWSYFLISCYKKNKKEKEKHRKTKEKFIFFFCFLMFAFV